MAQDISLLGAVYSSVPAVVLPKNGGGSALFADPSPVTASASDVLAGKYFIDSSGNVTEGTGSGGSATIEALTVTPTEEQQVIDANYYTKSDIWNTSTRSASTSRSLWASFYGKYKITGYIGQGMSYSVNSELIKVNEVFNFDGTDVDFTYQGETIGYTLTLKMNVSTVTIYASFSNRPTNTTYCFVDLKIEASNSTVDGYLPITVGAIHSSVYTYPLVERSMVWFSDSALSTIGYYAFAGITNLTRVSLPSVGRVSSYAFRDCNSLSNVYIPNVTSIDQYAFYNCQSLASVSFPSLTTAKSHCFEMCTKLEDVYFPVLSSVSDYTFQSCSKLSHIDLPNASAINTYAFNACPLLTSVSVPNVKSIYTYAFATCAALSEIDLPNATNIFANAFSATPIRIIRGSKFVSFGGNALLSRSLLAAISTPSAISVGSSAFRYCSALESAVFPIATTVSGTAFANCSTLSYAEFNSLSTSIGTSIFEDCRNLESVSFPLIEYVGSYMFKSCYKLSTVNFPKVSLINVGGFYHCSLLASAVLPSLNIIGFSAFQSCSTLSNVEYSLVTTISSSAFAGCYGITTISFQNVGAIGFEAFRGCSSLESAYFLTSTIPTLGTNAFLSTPLSLSSYLGHWGSIYVKASLLDSFKAATNWKTWKDRMVGLTDEQIAALG